jgi:hypothetical protein
VQDQDTVYSSYQGWPIVYKYVKGRLIDSSRQVEMFPAECITHPILFTEKDSLRYVYTASNRLLSKEPFEHGIYKIDEFVIRLYTYKNERYFLM